MAVPEIDIKAKGAERAKKTFLELAKRTKDLTPVWKDFKEYWQKDLMEKSFASKGALMQGSRWAPLTPSYRKWKAKSGGSKELMKLTKRLYNAAKGGSGWYEKIEKKSLEMGIKGIDYSAVHQYGKGKIPQRAYFMTKDEDIPSRGWAKLVSLTDQYLEEVDK